MQQKNGLCQLDAHYKQQLGLPLDDTTVEHRVRVADIEDIILAMDIMKTHGDCIGNEDIVLYGCEDVSALVVLVEKAFAERSEVVMCAVCNYHENLD